MRQLLTLMPIACLAFACETTRAQRPSTFVFTGDGMEEAFNRWRATAPPKTRAMIDKLDKDPTLLVHVLRGKIESDSRGSAAAPHSRREMKRACMLHPVADDIEPDRSWDVVYDDDLRKAGEKRYGIPSPVEALLQHEIIGHVVPSVMSSAGHGRAPTEDDAIEAENEYRKAVGLPLVPWKFGR